MIIRALLVLAAAWLPLAAARPCGAAHDASRPVAG
jgi:hypothetical protein